jgi:hypothetical protein
MEQEFAFSSAPWWYCFSRGNGTSHWSATWKAILMIDAVKGEWITVAIYVLVIGLAYTLHDQALAVTQAALGGIVLGQRLMRIRLANLTRDSSALSVRHGIRMPSLWRRRLSQPMDEKMRSQVTIGLFASIMGIAASRSVIFGDGTRWWNWAALILLLAMGAFCLILLGRDIWKPKNRSGDGWV